MEEAAKNKCRIFGETTRANQQWLIARVIEGGGGTKRKSGRERSDGRRSVGEEDGVRDEPDRQEHPHEDDERDPAEGISRIKIILVGRRGRRSRAATAGLLVRLGHTEVAFTLRKMRALHDCSFFTAMCRSGYGKIYQWKSQ